MKTGRNILKIGSMTMSHDFHAAYTLPITIIKQNVFFLLYGISI